MAEPTTDAQPAARVPRPRWLRGKHPGSSLGAILFYEVIRTVAQLGMMVLFGFRWRGAGSLPRKGAVLVVANHQSYLDPPLVGCAMKGRQFDFLARAGLFEVRWLKPLIVALHSVPVRESGGDTASIKEILRRLEMGRVVLIFPEGTRTMDGSVGPFKRGAAVILRRSQCPVLPVGIAGAHEAWPRGGKPRAFTGTVVVQVGEPIPHDELLADGVDAAMDRLRAEVESLRAMGERVRSGRTADASGRS
jgi:1-acyl-sn-glycerol-3-phosphate acyltransferase